MKNLIRLGLTLAILTTAVTTRAEWLGSHLRSNESDVMRYNPIPASGNAFDNVSHGCYPTEQPKNPSPRHELGLESTFVLPILDFRRPSRSIGGAFCGGLRTMPKLNRSYRTHTYGI